MSSINYSIGFDAIRSIHNLQATNRELSSSLEKIATGYRINSAKDDPAGMYDSVILSRDISAAETAIANNQDSYYTLATLDDTHSSIIETLQEIRTAVHSSANETDSATQNTLLAKVSSLIDSLDSFARSGKINENGTLAGASTITLDPSASNLLDTANTHIRKSGVDKNMIMSFNTANAAEQAYVKNTYTTPTVGNDSEISITTDQGTKNLTIAAGTNITDAAAAIDAAIDEIGAYAQVDGTEIIVATEEFGAERNIKIETVSGDDIFGAATVEDTAGVDGSININGQEYKLRDDLSVEVSSTDLRANLQFDASKVGLDLVTGTAPSTALVETGFNGGVVLNTGMNIGSNDSARYGFRDLTSNSLGLDKIVVNGETNYMLDHPEEALKTIEEAMSDILDSNIDVANIMNYDLESQNNFLTNLSEDLYDARASVVDTDQAYEIARSTRLQLLQQAGISALSAQNVSQQNVMSLLDNIG